MRNSILMMGVSSHALMSSPTWQYSFLNNNVLPANSLIGGWVRDVGLVG